MKTSNMSSLEIAGYNAANKAAIAAGLLEALTPSPETIAREKKTAEELAAGIKRFEEVVGLFSLIHAALPENVRAVYMNPTAPKAVSNNYGKYVWFTADNAKKKNFFLDTVDFESFTGGNSWSSSHKYFRIVIGGYGDKTIVKLNQNRSITPAQVAKVSLAIVNKFNKAVAEYKRRNAEAVSKNTKEAWLKIKSNNELAYIILGEYASQYNSDSKFSIAENGDITFDYETLTQAQWQQVADLKIAQAAAMKQLKDSFKA